ncbi:MAG: nucleotide exchange factor GrpE [Bacteroidota bacterium]|nr:nucleotide exchange factor GrpE [Bacteroidota bacterium]
MAKENKDKNRELEEEMKEAEKKSPDDFEGSEQSAANRQEEDDKSPDDMQEEKGRGKKKSKKKENKEKERISELEARTGELNDKYVRLYSEFDNFRKRTMKEKVELRNTASQDLITDLLPVMDDFERAIKSFDEINDAKEIKEGILLIYNKFKNVLKAKGLEEIDAKEQAFDTDFHEAITQIPAPSEELKGKVVDEIEKGYLLNGKVIRYSKVVVGS